jgi:hypothetical protein
MLNLESRQKFETFLRALLKDMQVDIRAHRRGGKPTHAPLTFLAFQGPASVFDVCYLAADPESGKKGRWVSWKQVPIASVYENVSGERMEELVVPTNNFVRYNCLLGWFLDARCPIMVNGPPACGKTMYLRQKMQNYLPSSKFAKSFFQVSPSTTSDILHRVVWEKLEAKSLGKMAPSEDRTLVVFVEDLNLVSRDVNGSSAVLEMVRHLFDKHSGYLQSVPGPPTLYHIDKVVIAASNQMRQGTGSSPLPDRLKRHLMILNIGATTEEELDTIFSRSLEWYHEQQGFPDAVSALRQRLVTASLAVYRQVDIPGSSSLLLCCNFPMLLYSSSLPTSPWRPRGCFGGETL